MKQDYWDALSGSFDEEVFDPVRNDIHQVICNTIRQLSNSRLSALDIGCGNGRNIPMLSNQFESVIGVDISPACLRFATDNYNSLQNVQFRKLDLSCSTNELEKADFALCLNVVLMPAYETRLRVLQNIMALIKPKGHLLLLLPALESVLLTIHRLILWNLQEHTSYKKAAAAANDELGFSARSIRDGIVSKGGTPTKHYTKEELELLIETLGQRVCEIKKVEYAWDTEFEHPPESMSAPYPWDWLVVSTPR